MTNKDLQTLRRALVIANEWPEEALDSIVDNILREIEDPNSA